jgi:hypothetical protein
MNLGLSPTCAKAADHGHPVAAKPIEGPAGNLHLHFCGIHVAKNNRKFQLIAHHYCGARGDVHQCLLFDSDAKDAKLLGIEYIVSDEQYQALPEEEKKYWHPHTYEVLAGGLTAPEMPWNDEMKFMKFILTTWGKTWHTWPDPSTPVPMGEPLLMWSLTGDGQIDEKVLAERDRMLEVDGDAIRKKRCEEIGYDVPQIPFPKSMNTLGRQWTASGEDKPTPWK